MYISGDLSYMVNPLSLYDGGLGTGLSRHMNLP